MKKFAVTDVGKKYDHNEDNYAFPELNKKYKIEKIDTENKGELFALCDGMGGGKSGETASELTANWLIRDYYSDQSGDTFSPEKLKTIIEEINNKIVKLAEEYDVYSGMGTTLVAVLAYKNKAYIYSVGDSRVYLLRDKKLTQITEDQSKVWELYKKGIIEKDDILLHPENNILTNVIGNDVEFEINSYEEDIKKDDLFLLCSDGLSDMLTDNEIEDILNDDNLSFENKCMKLVDEANERGGKDNITAILLKEE